MAIWRGPFGPVDFEGVTYGLRVHEFRRFLDLPHRSGETFHIALDIDPADEADREAFVANGWVLTDPRASASTPNAYRDFIGTSRAELMIAKHMYVGTRAGWFSDRSACYLAAGKPVVAQDTGFSDVLPCGEGLAAFESPEDAAIALADLRERYATHCEAAYSVAEGHLSTDVVLPRLLDSLLP